jgi:predicted phosphodiesterase
MIYFISDVHEVINFIGLKRYLEIATENDLLIILGDVGLNFQDTKQNRLFTEQFLSIDKNIAFIEGNHENFAYLDNFPTEKWYGGTVNRLTDKIVRLIRGNIYKIDGYKFFTFGGCKSSKKWKEQGLWHFGEEPTLEQIDFAKNTLIQHANTVDFVLTHKYEIIGQGENSTLLVDLCKFIDQNVSYKKWLSGHWHREYSLDDKHIYLHENLRSIDEIF